MARNWIKSAPTKPAPAAPSKPGQRARLADVLMGSKGKSKGGKVSSLPGMNKPAMRPDNPNDTPAMERRERRAGIRT